MGKSDGGGGTSPDAAASAQFESTVDGAPTPDAPSADTTEVATLSGREVGDYVLGPVIGSGGMGVIYSAVDAKLHRKVAIKVIRGQVSAAFTDYASSRLVREAQTMARLSHPNVVTIYQVGTIDDQVYVAMEFIDGQTLTQWLETARPTWRQALDVVMQAGRGLEAAHAAGVIHRDFKPDNILIGRDGRVLVTDFGLARAGLGIETPPSSVGLPKDANLTMTGAIMGTPAYMSPEQHEGRKSDARSDQYSYCITLYEALYQQRPFVGESWDDLAVAKENCTIAPVPSGSRVPRWLRGIIVRGLSTNPEERFPGMTDVLALIDAQRARRRSYLVFGVGAAVMATSVAALTIPRSTDDPAAACTAGSDRIAAVWTDAQQSKVRAAFFATKSPIAEASWTHASATLTAYSTSWRAMYRDACEATHTRRDQSERLLDRRMSCLRRREQELQAVVELFVAADASVVSEAAEAVNGLSRIQDCMPTEAMSVAAAENVKPDDPARRERISGELARAKALAATTKTPEAMAIAQRVVTEAKASGDTALEAEARGLVGRLHAMAGRFDDAKDALVRTIELAERARDVALRVSALVELVYIDGFELRKFAEAHVWARLAATAIEGSEGLAFLQARLFANRGTVFFAEGRYKEARDALEEALVMLRRTLGPDHIDVAVTTDRVGSVLLKMGSTAEAMPYHRAAIEILTKTLGETHFQVADAVNNLGNALSQAGDLDAAAVEYRRALSIWQQVLGPAHARTAVGHSNLGSLALMRADYSTALLELESALKVETASSGGSHPSVAETLTAIGSIHLARKTAAEGVPYLERALEIWKAIPEPPVDEAKTQFMLAQALWPTDRRRALELAHTARSRLAGAGAGWQETYAEVEAWIAERP